MNHHTSPSIWVAFEKLPREIQDLARANYELLRENPRHPSLHFKKAGGNWSVRVGLGYRALCELGSGRKSKVNAGGNH